MTRPARPRLLDEHAAWCEMAMLCEGPFRPVVFGLVPIDHPSGPGDGLCVMVGRLYGNSGAGRNARLRLLDHLPRLSYLDGRYSWSHTRRGWTSRARFCWRMAELCEAESNGWKEGEHGEDR